MDFKKLESFQKWNSDNQIEYDICNTLFGQHQNYLKLGSLRTTCSYLKEGCFINMNFNYLMLGFKFSELCDHKLESMRRHAFPTYYIESGSYLLAEDIECILKTKFMVLSFRAYCKTCLDKMEVLYKGSGNKYGNVSFMLKSE